ncbi:hypothetical protein H0A36_21405 [Endozoicomonas sp. SM1973]|uniref:DUF2975 domain-containing protein n=1 Tax=Spartinivicinus marinus TaxID=2994442 RepID=A0A853ILF6_9GAMM|nr:hypothetical protein [Spartinivicinus marinus]MCX4027097.1 hypothetical protein [Spartinivicinus marinus]NYZ68576.1 hypothetical protein [Spartinivicinus marinus]
MNSLNKIKLTSGMAVVSLLIFLTYNIYLFVSGEGFVLDKETSDNVEVFTRVMTFIGLELLYQVILIMLLMCVFFQFYNGKIFDLTNLRYSFAIGWLCLLYPVYSYGIDFLLDAVFQPLNITSTFTVNINLMPMATEIYLIAGIVILPIVYILKHGSALKSELEEYI